MHVVSWKLLSVAFRPEFTLIHLCIFLLVYWMQFLSVVSVLSVLCMCLFIVLYFMPHLTWPTNQFYDCFFLFWEKLAYIFSGLCLCQVSKGPERPVLAVLTDRDLLLYPTLPESKESLSSPTKSHPLITTRSEFTGSPCSIIWCIYMCGPTLSSTVLA